MKINKVYDMEENIMMTISISFDNVNEALVALNAVKQFNGAVADFTPTVEAKETEPIETETTANESPVSSSTEVDVNTIQGIINALVNMTPDELESMFGYGNDKPYRVIKNIGFEEAKRKLGDKVDTNIRVMYSLDDVNAAINLITKDVSVGGMSHDTMERLFNVRTSKNLFKQSTLDEIISVLKDEGLI